MNRESVDDLLSVSETVVDGVAWVADKLPQSSCRESGSARQNPSQQNSSASEYSFPVPPWLSSLRGYLRSYMDRYFFRIIIGTWLGCTAFSFVLSPLIVFFSFHAMFFIGIVIFEWDIRAPYRGFGGIAFRIFTWLMFSMAIVVPSFTPVLIAVQLVRWVLN